MSGPSPSPARRRRCSRTDAVLALCLDGDLEVPFPQPDSGQPDSLQPDSLQPNGLQPGQLPLGSAAFDQHDDGAGERYDGTFEESGWDFLCPQTLADHLRACPDCQRALRRARRLDAGLAEASGRTLHAQTSGASWQQFTERCFAVAVAGGVAASEQPEVTEPRPTAEEGRTGPQPEARGAALTEREVATTGQRRWLLAALLAIGFAIVAQSSTRNESGAGRAGEDRTAADRPAAHDLAAGLPSVGFPSVGDPAGTRITAAAEVLTPSASPPAAGSVPDVATGPRPPEGGVRAWSHAQAPAADRASSASGDSTSGATPTDVPSADTVLASLAQLGDRTAAPVRRLLAAQHLLQTIAASPTAARSLAPELVLLLASSSAAPEILLANGSAQRTLGNELLAHARGCPRFLAHLQQNLRQLANTGTARVRPDDLQVAATVTVAARLGQDDLDATLVRAVRRHAELATVLAAALRCEVRVRGSAALMLDAWQALVVRGQAADDLDAARSWFAAMPRTVFDELGDELAAARSASRRLRCLLAMGCCDDGRTVPHLVAQLGSARQDDALAAAFALAHLPHRDLLPLVAQARERNNWLLRAALLFAGIEFPEGAPTRMQALTASGESAEATFARFVPFAHEVRERSTSTGG